MSSDTQTLARDAPIRSIWSIIWMIVLIALAIGATTNLLLLSDVVQPYCSTTPNDDTDLCAPCGLQWGMFGIIDVTQCPNSIVDEVLWILVAIPRLLAVVFGLAWFVTAPILVFNFSTLLNRRRRGEQTTIETIQLGLLAYILLWGAAVAAFFLLPAIWALVND